MGFAFGIVQTLYKMPDHLTEEEFDLKDDNIFFSVIVLAYQVRDYIAQCLDSVLCQTYQNFEIILVNPHSSDGTDGLCLEYQKKHGNIRILKTENRGQLLNRISGFAEAKGDYLLCLDGDDYWEKNLLETVCLGIREHGGDWVIFGHERVCGGKVIGCTEHIFPDGTVLEGEEKKKVYEKLIAGRPLNTMWEKALSRELFGRIMREEDFLQYQSVRSCEDLLFNCHAAWRSARILYLDFSPYRYRMRADSVTHVFRPAELDDYLLVKKRVREFMTKWQMEDENCRSMFYSGLFRFFADWIYRCAISGVTAEEKRGLYGRLRQEALYLEALRYRKNVRIHMRHRLFELLFRHGDLGLRIYAKAFQLFRKYNRKRRTEVNMP